GVLAPDDRELILETRARRRQVVHKEGGAKYRDCERQQPHQPGILNVDAAGTGGALVEIDDAEPHQERREELNAADADIAAGCVQTEPPALPPIGIKE